MCAGGASSHGGPATVSGETLLGSEILNSRRKVNGGVR